jgi:GTPase involved in cell partitioning and DNA repair
MLELIVGGVAVYEIGSIGLKFLKHIEYDEQGRIYGIKAVVKAARIMHYDFDYCDDELYYYVNVKTKEFWALINNEHGNWKNDENIIRLDPSDYTMFPEIVTVEQLEMIRDMVIKKYTLYKDTAREQKPKSELCNCGMFYK